MPFGAWLFRIARNQIASHYRRRTPSHDLQDAALPSPAPASDAATDLARGLARLSETDRELLSLKFFDDLPTPVLADGSEQVLPITGVLIPPETGRGLNPAFSPNGRWHRHLTGPVKNFTGPVRWRMIQRSHEAETMTLIRRNRSTSGLISLAGRSGLLLSWAVCWLWLYTRLTEWLFSSIVIVNAMGERPQPGHSNLPPHCEIPLP